MVEVLGDVIGFLVVVYGEYWWPKGSLWGENKVELGSQEALLTGVSPSLCVHSDLGRSSNDEQ